MSDPRFRDDPIIRSPDPLAPSVSDRDYSLSRDDRDLDRNNNGPMWGILAVIAILAIGGFMYFTGGSNVASNTMTPTTQTTGSAPRVDTRPTAPLTQAPATNPTAPVNNPR